jgi:hypothetical protein
MRRNVIFRLPLLLVIVLLSGLAYAAQDRGRWESLGRTEADFKNDHDRIDVGRHEGKFRQLDIRAEGAPVEIHRMVVTFADGKKFEPNIKHRFDEGSRSHTIDLPGDHRAIKSIDLYYRSPNRKEGKAKVEVYAR